MPQPNQDAGTGRKSSEAAHVPVGAPVENAQGQAASDPPTPETAAARQGDERSALARALDIPEDIAGQIFGNKDVKSAEADHVPGSEEVRDEQTDADDGPTESEEESETGDGKPETGEVEAPAETGPESEEEGAEEGEQRSEPKSVRKLSRRVNKLTARLGEREERIAELEDTLAKFQQNGQQQNADAAIASPSGLENVRDERELNQVVGRARNLIEFCDANTEGVETGEGENKRFVAPDEIAKWRRNAEKIMLNAPERRQQIRDFTGMQQHFNAAAKELFPELFPSREEIKSGDVSNEYLFACQLAQAAPQVFASLPEANLLLGHIVVGKKFQDDPEALLELVQKRVAQRKNGQNARSTNQAGSLSHAHPDIPKSLLKRQPPLAPVTASPPSSIPTDRGSKKVKEATDNLVADPDGGAGALTDYFAASTGGERQSGGRKLVNA